MTRSPTRTGTGRTSTAFLAGEARGRGRVPRSARRSLSSAGTGRCDARDGEGREEVSCFARGWWWTRRGPGGFLHRALAPASSRFPDLPETAGALRPFHGVRRLDEIEHLPFRRGRRPTRWTTPPSITSSTAAGSGCSASTTVIAARGVAAEPVLAAELGLAEGAPAWDRLLERFPTVGLQFETARPTIPSSTAGHALSRRRRGRAGTGRCSPRRPPSWTPCSRPASR